MNTCPDCKCEFVQPFRCATCGAQKLYDHTVTSQQQTIDALRARVAELEGDLNVARLQLSARVCSECPAKEGVAELAQLLDEGSAYVHSFAMLSKHPTAPAYAMDLAQRMRSAAGLSGNKTAASNEVPK